MAFVYRFYFTTLTLTSGRVPCFTASRMSRLFAKPHITTVLLTLHWLPLEYRVQFKLLTLTDKAIHNGTIIHAVPQRTLRSENQLRLEVPWSRTQLWDRAFSVVAATLWIKIPLVLRPAPSADAFKKHMKTNLFTRAS